jgi:hypothetical protein
MFPKSLAFALCTVPLALSATETLQVGLGDATTIRLPADAAQIVVGSPAIADVTLQSPRQLVLFGKYPGGTRLQVTDSRNQLLFDRRIIVTATSADGVTLRYGTGKNWVMGGTNAALECGSTTCSPAIPVPTDSPVKSGSAALTAPASPALAPK